MAEQDLTVTNGNPWVRGEDTEFTLAITDASGNPENLTGCLVTLEIKKSANDPDPALLALDSNLIGGITIRTQSGADLGYADGIATNVQTYAMAQGTYRYDVFITLVSGLRKRALFGEIQFVSTPNDP